MKARSLKSGLMAGVACITLGGTAALAEGWSGMVVFGDRWLDSGQFVSYDAVFNTEGRDIGDGRSRATSLTQEGGYAEVYSQRLSRALGFGELTPSQPATYAGALTPKDGLNYAGLFNFSDQVLASINGTRYGLGSIVFRSGDGTELSVPGRSKPGFLKDAGLAGDGDTHKTAWNALVLVNGGMRDLRSLANIDRKLDESIDIDRSYISLYPSDTDWYAERAATNIADGVEALADAGAGLIVVPNMVDLTKLPETAGDQVLVEQADTELQVRERVAEAAETFALAQEQIAATATEQAIQAATTAQQRANAAQAAAAAAIAADDALEATINADPGDAVAIANAEQVLANARASQINAETQADVALNVAIGAAMQADAQIAAAEEARKEANKVALSYNEIQLRAHLDAAIADTSLISDVRDQATKTYNKELYAQLQGIDGNILLVDQNSLLDAIIRNPERFGFAREFNQSLNCEFSSSLYPCEEVNSSEGDLLFSDGLDLTAAGHQALSDQITALISAPSAVSGLPFVGINAARGIGDSARDQVRREQMLVPGIAPFATAIGTSTTLDPRVGRDQHEARFVSGLAGVKMTLGEGIAVGGGFGYQQMHTPGTDSVFEYNGDAYYGTLFAGIDQGPVFANVAATYGKLDFGSTMRRTHINTASILNRADTEGTVFGIGGEAGARLVQYKDVIAGPIASFSHFSSEVDGFSERGWQVTAVTVDDLDGSSTRAGIGAFIEAGKLVGGRGMVFRAKALYGHEFADDERTVSVTPNAPNSLGSFSAPARGADSSPLEFGAEIVFGAGPVTTTLGYSGLFGDNSVHTIRLGASLPL